ICVYFFSSRSSAAWAKKALADFRISLARRSSRFSFSSALRRSRSSVVTPDRIPRSTSDRLIQASRVVGVQPIFGAIDSIAAHSDRYSSRCSCTRRTARSRTSGENLLFLLMAPFSQEMKPPQNPGRFKPNLLTFSEKILTPYLYSFCHKIKYGRYPYGELAHNAPGLVEDYKALFKVHDKEGVLRALEALSKSPRVANKLPCPCGCSQRLGKCNYRFFLSRFRNVEKRRETKETLQKTAQEKQTELHSKKHDYF